MRTLHRVILGLNKCGTRKSVRYNKSDCNSVVFFFSSDFNLEDFFNDVTTTTTKAPPKVFPRVPAATKAPAKPKPKPKPGERKQPNSPPAEGIWALLPEISRVQFLHL